MGEAHPMTDDFYKFTEEEEVINPVPDSSQIQQTTE